MLAHAREQKLFMGVAIVPQGGVLIADVAAMLDPILINSSNNSDRVDELRDQVQVRFTIRDL